MKERQTRLYKTHLNSDTKALALILTKFQEAGLPIGGPDYNRFVMLEVHYNNPELKAGKDHRRPSSY